MRRRGRRRERKRGEEEGEDEREDREEVWEIELEEEGGGGERGGGRRRKRRRGEKEKWKKTQSHLIRSTSHMKILLSLKAKRWRRATRLRPHSQLVRVRSEGKSIHHRFCSGALSSSDWDGKFSASLVEEIWPCSTTP